MVLDEIGSAASEPAPGRATLGWELSRRQFVVVLGGTASAIAVAWGYGVTATDSPPTRSSLWSLRVVRAGRGARLNADGQPAFQVGLGPSVFDSHADRAGASRPVNSSLAVAAVGSFTSHSDHFGGGSAVTTPYPQPENLTWGDVVVLEVEVHNTATVPTLFSPGQLRLRLANGPTITLQDASQGPEAIAAGATEVLWVSYLAPSDGTDFSVEFTDPRRDGPVALRVPGLASAKA